MRERLGHRLRNAGLTVVLGSLRTLLRLLTRVVPQSQSVVLSVFPETEGNGVEVARALVRRYDGRVVWLRDDARRPVPDDVGELVRHGMVLVPKASLAGLWAYLRAEAVFFTHGLYGNPEPWPHKPVVNLWHGDGPKDITPAKTVGSKILSTYLVGSTPLFSRFQGAAFDVPAEQVLVTGNPRTDQFWRPPGAEKLERLGITGDFVLWMPTFRQARAIGAVRVHTTCDDVTGGREELGPLLDGLEARGLQLVIRPHPIDADRRQWGDITTVDDDDLAAAGVSLYSLIGASSGLVTDYSSVWVDYLLLDRPMAFSVPDRTTYDRALYPSDVLDWVPGEVVDLDGRPFEEFFTDLDAQGRLGAEQRRAVAERIGLIGSSTAADDLVTALVKLGALSSG